MNRREKALERAAEISAIVAHPDRYLDDAYAEYAEAFECRADALTAAEKQQALLNFVLEKGRELE